MYASKVLLSLLAFIYALFIYFLFSGYVLYAENITTLILPIITLAYFYNVKKRSTYFTVFLILHSISDLMFIISEKLPDDSDYYIGNSLYILAYLALIVEIGKNLSFQYIFKKYLFSIIIMFFLNYYISYELLQIVNPNLILSTVYIIELVYNISMLMVLTLALLNYLDKDNKKAFYILIGAICIVFLEVINIAYLYVSGTATLKFFSFSLGLLGFYFLYEQSNLSYRNKENRYY